MASDAGPLAAGLGDAGFAVRAPATSPHDVHDPWFDEAGAAVLDTSLGLPAFLERWRRGDARPVVFLTTEAEFDRLATWRRPGDDFVLRPASPREVAFRLRAALARPRVVRPAIVLDPDTREVIAGQRRVSLTRLEFAVLEHLAAHPGQAFTRDELLRAVWGSRSEWQQPSTVTEHVRRVRAKLDPDAPDRWIRTVHGVGYVFVA